VLGLGTKQQPKVSFVFMSAKLKSPAKKRPAPDEPAPTETKRAKTDAGDDEYAEHLECGICQDIIHKAISVVPCMHNFCAGCISDWRSRSKECPECRADMQMLSKNHALNKMVGALAAHICHSILVRLTDALKPRLRRISRTILTQSAAKRNWRNRIKRTLCPTRRLASGLAATTDKTILTTTILRTTTMIQTTTTHSGRPRWQG
jgi:hypothetical protein